MQPGQHGANDDINAPGVKLSCCLQGWPVGNPFIRSRSGLGYFTICSLQVWRRRPYIKTHVKFFQWMFVVSNQGAV